MQHGNARPFAVMYMTVQLGGGTATMESRRRCASDFMPGSEAAPEALKLMPRDAAMAAARSMWPASSRDSCSYSA